MQSLKTDKEKGTAIIVISALGEIPLGKAVKEHTKEDLAQMGITKNDMALSLPDGTDALGNAK